MTSQTGVVLTLLDDDELRALCARAAAAAGLRMVAASSTITRRAWSSATAVILDDAAVHRCGDDGLPRRDSVILVSGTDPDPATWTAAMAIGVQHLCTLPAEEDDLVRHLSEAAETEPDKPARGRLIAVTPGRGGAGASVFAAALALVAADSLLVDLDPWSGGIDLLLGTESATGLRWPDLSLQGGRLSWPAVRDALPTQHGVTVLSGTRSGHEMEAAPVESVLDAGRRGGVMVVCDVPRRSTPAAAVALECADLVLAVTTCDVRAVAAMSARAAILRAANPNVALVVRGPSPGGLTATEVAEVTRLPLLAAMRPEPMLAQRLEHGGIRLGRRSPLAAAARQVLEALRRGSGMQAA